jgi:hypothetical protein
LKGIVFWGNSSSVAILCSVITVLTYLNNAVT